MFSSENSRARRHRTESRLVVKYLRKGRRANITITNSIVVISHSAFCCLFFALYRLISSSIEIFLVSIVDSPLRSFNTFRKFHVDTPSMCFVRAPRNKYGCFLSLSIHSLHVLVNDVRCLFFLSFFFFFVLECQNSTYLEQLVFQKMMRHRMRMSSWYEML